MGQLPPLSDEEIEPLMKRLAHRASRKLRALTWRGALIRYGGAIPRALEPEDFVAEAFLRVLNEKRSWDPERHPDFGAYMRGVVDSLISSAVESVENQRSVRLPLVKSAAGDGGASPRELDPQGDEEEPWQIMIKEEEEAGWRRRLDALARRLEDDPLGRMILECLHAGITKPAEMAQLAEVPVDEIYKAQRRFDRAVVAVTKETRTKERP